MLGEASAEEICSNFDDWIGTDTSVSVPIHGGLL
jgi:hypothetical protein